MTLNNEKPLQEISLEMIEGDSDIFISFEYILFIYVFTVNVIQIIIVIVNVIYQQKELKKLI